MTKLPPRCTFLALVLGLAALGGCSNQKVNDDPILLNVVGPTAVDVETFGGNVTITANPWATQATVLVDRRALHGWGRREEAELSLANIGYTVELVPGELGPVLQVRATATDPEPHFLRADLTIEVPELDAVRVRTERGDVTAIDFQGGVDIVAAGGRVRAMTPYPILTDVRVINNSGSIEFRVRAESTGAIDAAALRGDVVPWVKNGELIVHAGTDQDTLLATLNGGVNRYLFRAADGDIRIAVVPAPTNTGRYVLD